MEALYVPKLFLTTEFIAVVVNDSLYPSENIDVSDIECIYVADIKYTLFDLIV